MPIYYERDRSKRIVVATSVGTVTLNDALEVIDRQVADRPFGPDPGTQQDRR